MCYTMVEMKLTITQVKDCELCKRFLRDNPSLDSEKSLTKMKLSKLGKWYHSTLHGKMLHALVSKSAIS